MCFFAACSNAEDTENLFEMTTLQEQENLEMSLKIPSEKGLETGIEYDTGGTTELALSEEYQYGNMQKNAPPGNFMLYENKIVFVNFDNQYHAFTLCMMDKKTKEISLFCRDATCMHNTAECVSGGVTSNLEQYDGKLYALNSDNQIMELKNGQFETITNGAVYNFWHANGNLYAVSRDGALVVFENNNKPRILVEEYTDRWNVVFGNYLYGCTTQGISRVDLSAENPQKEMLVQSGDSMIDGEHIYYFDNETFCLYRCDMDGSNSIQLTDQPVLPASINFDGEYVYFRFYMNLDMEGLESHAIYRMQKKNTQNIEKIAELPNYVYTIYTVPNYDKLIVVTQASLVQDVAQEYYMVEKDGNSVEKLEIPEF